MEEVAARGDVGCAVGQQAAVLRQEGVSDKGTQQSPEAHEEVENLGREERSGEGAGSSFTPIPDLGSHQGSPGLAGVGSKRVGGRRGQA